MEVLESALPTLDLAQQCADEMARYQCRRPHDANPCYGLFRRALVHRDQAARSALFHQYNRLIRRWVQGAPGGPDTPMNEAFTHFWRALPSPRFEQFSSLSEILIYLKRRAQSVAIDARWREEQERMRASAIAQIREAVAEDRWLPPVECLLDRLVRGELYARAMASLKDLQERLAFRASSATLPVLSLLSLGGGTASAQSPRSPWFRTDAAAPVGEGADSGAAAADPPVPLPRDCDALTTPGGDPPACCLRSYIYYGDTPPSDAATRSESAHGSMETTTAGGTSNAPYHQVSLSATLLPASAGDPITITASYGDITAGTPDARVGDGNRERFPGEGGHRRRGCAERRSGCDGRSRDRRGGRAPPVGGGSVVGKLLGPGRRPRGRRLLPSQKRRQ